MKNQKGFGLLMAVLMVVAMLVTFLYLATYTSQNMIAQLSQTKRQLAGYKAMQDFAVMAQSAYQTFRYNGDACPVGTTRLPAGKPFCWPSVAPGNCIHHPIPNAAGTRMICLDSAAAERMEVISKKDKSIPWWKNFLSGFGVTAEAQVREPHLPTLVGAPTISYAATPNCGTAFNSSYCKLCEVSGGNPQNLECIYLRVCLSSQACDSGSNARWTFQRLGVQIIP